MIAEEIEQGEMTPAADHLQFCISRVSLATNRNIPKREFLAKWEENLANDDPAQQERLVDVFRDLILGR